MAMKNYDRLNSISDARNISLMASNQTAQTHPRLLVLLEINISLSELKGNYIGNLCHSIITDTRIIFLAVFIRSSILRASFVVFNVF